MIHVYTTRRTAVVKPVTYNKGTCYSSLVILCVGHWSKWSMCLLVQLLCFFFHNKTRMCNVIFLPIQLEVCTFDLACILHFEHNYMLLSSVCPCCVNKTLKDSEMERFILPFNCFLHAQQPSVYNMKSCNLKENNIHFIFYKSSRKRISTYFKLL